MTPPADQPEQTEAPPDHAAGRFVWPPRPIDLAKAEADLRDAPPIAAPRPTTVVDPDPPEVPSTGPVAPAPRPRAVAADVERPASPWRRIEETWLGLTTPTLAERIAEASWSPEPVDAACPRCASTLVNAAPEPAGCEACREKKLRWDRAIRLAEYDGLVRDVIHEIKFTAWRRLGVDAGRLLGRVLDAELTAAGLPRGERDQLVLVPVPISFWRRMSRGIDHALAICRGVQMETGGRVVGALGRRHRPSQVSVPSSRRGTNVSGSMYRRLGGGAAIAGRWVVVVDDVRTSGATLAEACRALGAVSRGRDGPGQRLGSARAGTTKDGGSDGPIEVWTAVLGVAEDDRRSGGSR